jgi:predicted lipoprotein with Yx(FWY)xxD motif
VNDRPTGRRFWRCTVIDALSAQPGTARYRPGRGWTGPHRVALPLLGAVLVGSLLGSCTAAGSSPLIERGNVIGTGRIGQLGDVLVNARGRTLYIYTPDKQGPSKCSGICLVQWPPLLTSEATANLAVGPGVDKSLVGAVRRPNGTSQVTYNRWPLYTYRLDTAAGQATGEGNDMGLWQVISPDGQPIP